MKSSWTTLSVSLVMLLLFLICCPSVGAQACSVAPPTITVNLASCGDVEVQNDISSIPGGNNNLNVRGEGFTFCLSYWPSGTRITPQVSINLSNQWSAFAWDPNAISLTSYNRLPEPITDYSALVNSRPEYARLWQVMMTVCSELTASDQFWEFMAADDTQKADLSDILTDISSGYYAPDMRNQIIDVEEVAAPNYYHDMQILYGFTIQGEFESSQISVWDGGSGPDGFIYIDVDGQNAEDRYHLTIHDRGSGSIIEPIIILWDAGNPACPLVSEELWNGIIGEIRYALWDVGGKQIINPSTNPRLHRLLQRAAGSFGLAFPELEIVYPVESLNYQTNIL